MTNHSSGLPPTRGDLIIDELLRFSRSALSASAVVLAWLNEDGDPSDAGNIGLREALLEDYFSAGVYHHDPLFPGVLVSKPEKIHCLSSLASHGTTRTAAQDYTMFLTRYGYRDEIDLVFSNGAAPSAHLVALSDTGFAYPRPEIEALHRFLQHTISGHPYIRKQTQAALLRDRFALTHREIQVVDLIRSGASNADIGKNPGIGLATVKTHVIRVLDKLSVDSRCALVAFVNEL
ncbi:MAG: LuxR C-terminal-related transcriptional regulator [Sphingomonadaceae bacterium]